MVKACRRTLLSVWRSKPQPDGQVPYDDFGEVTLSTMPLSCFPNISFPEDAHDPAAVRRFVQGLSFTLPLQRDMTEARTYEAGGKTFVMTQGTIAYKAEDEALSRRISVALAMTEQRGYLLIWLFAAPHEAELRELMEAKVGFAPSSRSAGVPMTTPGVGTAAQQEPPKPPKPDLTLPGDGTDTAKAKPEAATSSDSAEPPPPTSGVHAGGNGGAATRSAEADA